MEQSMKILITGANGFVGRNLCAHLEAIGYDDLLKYDRPDDEAALRQYASDCDFVFHLAGINRPDDESGFAGNYLLTEVLLEALKKENRTIPVLLSSSVQALLDNPYGRSKKKAEELVLDYGRETQADIYVYRLPNVFGKWCAPNYNSAVATFCHNIARGLPIRIDDPNAALTLVYIDDVLKAFTAAIHGNALRNGDFCAIEPVYHTTVGSLAEIIRSFSQSRKNLTVPKVSDPLIRKLYSTYLSDLPEAEFSYPLLEHKDHRGLFAEALKSKDAGQVSVNITKPGMVKAGHWHHTKTEKLIVVSGSGLIRFRRLGDEKLLLYPVSAERLEVVDIPPGYTHDIINTGSSDLVMLVWANQVFDPNEPDTHPAIVDPASALSQKGGA